MEHLNYRESVLNCPICRNSGVKRQMHLPKHYTKEYSPGMHQFWQHNKHMPVSPIQSRENLIKHRTIMQKYMSYRDGYEQIHRKSMMYGVKDAKKSTHKSKRHHANMPAIIYQVYTLAADNNKPRKKPSSTVYSYPYSSSSAESSTSFIYKNRKRSITMHPSTKKHSVDDDDDDDDTDSEFNTCKKFPITQKHYRHIVDGIECSSYYKKPSSALKKRPKEDKYPMTRRADLDFNINNQTNLKQSNQSNSHAYQMKEKEKEREKEKEKEKKKCNCKSKCKHNVEEERSSDSQSKCKHNVKEERSDSQLSEKTFTKFINSLHSYVHKTKKFNNHKCQRKVLDSDSSCSLCLREQQKHTKKRKSSKEKIRDAKKHRHHHHHHHHRSSREKI